MSTGVGTVKKSNLFIEVGGTYFCRNGCKARVYATDARGPYPVHGATYHKWFQLQSPPDGGGSHEREVEPEDCMWVCRTWTEKGQYYFDQEHPLDLDIKRGDLWR